MVLLFAQGGYHVNVFMSGQGWNLWTYQVDRPRSRQNIDVSRDIASLRGVDRQLAKKLEGLEASSAKASKRRMEVEGQLSLDLENRTDEGR